MPVWLTVTRKSGSLSCTGSRSCRRYGSCTARHFGKPGCGRPLFKMNDDTGEIIHNSHVSHICARSEGGPRWDPEMSEEENRSESNLIPMCLEHAYEIDVTPELYRSSCFESASSRRSPSTSGCRRVGL